MVGLMLIRFASVLLVLMFLSLCSPSQRTADAANSRASLLLRWAYLALSNCFDSRGINPMHRF